MLSIMEKKLIVQLGYIETETEYFDFIAFDGEYYKGKKEVYSYHGSGYIDEYYFESDVCIFYEHNFGKFTDDHYEQLTHEIICLADDLKNIGRTITLEYIKNLVNTYKNENL